MKIVYKIKVIVDEICANGFGIECINVSRLRLENDI